MQTHTCVKVRPSLTDAKCSLRKPLAAMYPDPNQQNAGLYASHGHGTTQAGPVPSSNPQSTTYAAAPQPAPGTSQPYNAYAYSAQQPGGYGAGTAGAGAAGPGGYSGGQPGGGAYAAGPGYTGMQQPQQPYNPMQFGGNAFMPGPPQQQVR